MLGNNDSSAKSLKTGYLTALSGWKRILFQPKTPFCSRVNNINLKSRQTTPQQRNPTVNIERWDTLGYELLALWQQVHGAPEGAVQVIASQNGLLVFMENVFSQAELSLARQARDNVLEQYIDSLSHQILPTLTSRLAQLSDQQIGTTSITSNIEQNWMLVFIRFDEPIISEDNL